MGESCCGDGADGIGNGMTLVENIYWSTRDALVSSVATVSTFVGSIFSDVKLQRINATYSSGSRTLSAEVIPKSEVAQEVAMSTLALASAIPSGGSAGTGMLMAKAGTKATATSSAVQVLKEGSNAEKLSKQLVKYGENGNLPTPKTDKGQFKQAGGEKVHSETEAIYRKSDTQHRGKDGEFKIFPKGTTEFGKTSKTTGNRITTDLNGKIIGH
jgi:hypothetical protein